MREMIAVFKSRRDAIAFSMAMNGQGIRVQAVGTPAAIGSSCGLSVRFSAMALPLARRVLSYGEYQSFRGFYEI